MADSFQNMGVVGGGAWGTALAGVLARAGRTTLLWAFEKDVVEAINKKHENAVFLPGVKLDPAIRATNDLADLSRCEALILAAPAQHMRPTIKKLAAALKEKIPLIVCAKGIEQKTYALMSEVAEEELPGHPLAILSGPSFAREVARGAPTALTLAVGNKALGERLVMATGSSHFRLYLTDDVIGAQMGGALKNVLAVACGIAFARGMGENARAALITRGLAEMTRLGVAMGGRAETMAGLSGLGDLVLTCVSEQSRNTTLGEALGRGEKLEDIVKKRSSVAEGVYTASAAAALAKKHNVEMPITAAVDAILNKGAAIDPTIDALLSRPFRPEH